MNRTALLHDLYHLYDFDIFMIFMTRMTFSPDLYDLPDPDGSRQLDSEQVRGREGSALDKSREHGIFGGDDNVQPNVRLLWHM